MMANKFHGVLPRGLNSVPQSLSFEGRFGRMFRTLPPARHTKEDLKALAEKMIAPFEAIPTPEDQVDNEENQGIDAGYTYLGQFIDHDLTFDPASSLQKVNDPDALVDFRTPRFDLDSLYGRGSDDQPYLYAADGLSMILGRKFSGNPHDPNTRDLARNSSDPQRAIIGDPRNDENVIISQLQSSFTRFHNSIVKFFSQSGQTPLLPEIQRQVRWHYQWVVLHDFLTTIVGKEMVRSILPHLASGKSIFEDKPRLQFYHFNKDPYMPVEFSVAAYRFGHSMVRPIYRLNTTLQNRLSIFSSNINESLVGFRSFPDVFAVDWNLFFNPGNAPITGKDRIQKAYKIDTSLVNPLGSLPASIAREIPSLAERNLLRGLRMGLPSGQSVARQMHQPVISDTKLQVGKATKDDSLKNIHLTDISPNFKNNAPLWYYILAEAQQSFKEDNTPIFLGSVGGRIVAEVIIGILLGDSHSFLSQDPSWTPRAEFQNNGTFKMIDLIAQAQKD